LVDILIAALLFVVVLAADYALWYAADTAHSKGVPAEISAVSHGLAYLIFVLDVVCVVFLVTVASIKLVREIIATLQDDE